MFAHLNPQSSDFGNIWALSSPFLVVACVPVVVCVARKLRPCLSYSRGRDCINSVFLCSLDNGGGLEVFLAAIFGAPAPEILWEIGTDLGSPGLQQRMLHCTAVPADTASVAGASPSPRPCASVLCCGACPPSTHQHPQTSTRASLLLCRGQDVCFHAVQPGWRQRGSHTPESPWAMLLETTSFLRLHYLICFHSDAFLNRTCMSARRIVLLVLHCVGGAQARVFGNCVPVDDASDGWARLLDYSCDFMAYLLSLLRVCIPAFAVLALLLLCFAAWLAWLCCRCASPACDKKSRRCMKRCTRRLLLPCAPQAASKKYRLFVRVGSALVLLLCVAALALSWTGFLEARHGFYDALDQWSVLWGAVVDGTERVHAALSTAEDGLQGLPDPVNVTVEAGDFSRYTTLVYDKWQNARAVQAYYQLLRNAIDLFYLILLIVVILYTAALFVVAAALPLNVHVLRWSGVLPRDLLGAFFGVGLLVGCAVVAAQYLDALFADFCAAGAEWVTGE